MEPRIARIETHVEHLNANVEDLRTRFVRLETKVDDLGIRLDAKIDALGRRLDAKIDGRFDTLDAKIDRHVVLLGGMIVSLGVGMAGLMAEGFHWL